MSISRSSAVSVFRTGHAQSVQTRRTHARRIEHEQWRRRRRRRRRRCRCRWKCRCWRLLLERRVRFGLGQSSVQTALAAVAALGGRRENVHRAFRLGRRQQGELFSTFHPVTRPGCVTIFPAVFSLAFSQLQNLSAEVSTVRRALLRAKEESGTHPLAPTPEESLVQILQESDWPNALTYAKQNKYVCLDDQIIIV